MNNRRMGLFRSTFLNEESCAYRQPCVFLSGLMGQVKEPVPSRIIFHESREAPWYTIYYTFASSTSEILKHLPMSFSSLSGQKSRAIYEISLLALRKKYQPPLLCFAIKGSFDDCAPPAPLSLVHGTKVFLPFPTLGNIIILCNAKVCISKLERSLTVALAYRGGTRGGGYRGYTFRSATYIFVTARALRARAHSRKRLKSSKEKEREGREGWLDGGVADVCVEAAQRETLGKSLESDETRTNAANPLDARLKAYAI